MFKSENRVDKHHPSSFLASSMATGHGVSDLGSGHPHNLTPLHHSSLPLGNAHNNHHSSASPVHHNHTPNTIHNIKWTPHKDNLAAKDRTPKDVSCPWSAAKPSKAAAANNHRDWTWNFDWRRERRHGDVE